MIAPSPPGPIQGLRPPSHPVGTYTVARIPSARRIGSAVVTLLRIASSKLTTAIPGGGSRPSASSASSATVMNRNPAPSSSSSCERNRAGESCSMNRSSLRALSATPW